MIRLSPMGLSSVKQDMWFGWNVKNFAQNLLICPGSTQKGRGSMTPNLEVVICRWEGREGRGSIDSQVREDL